MSIVIFGQKENGKSTLATMLTDLLSPCHYLTRTQFAKPIKDTLAKMTGWGVEYLDSIKDETPPHWNCTVRQAYQKLGDVGRSIRQDIYTSRALSIPKSIIEDGRFEDELKANAGGYNILLIRPTHLNTDSHNSETWVGEQARYRLANPTAPYGKWNRVVINDYDSTDEWYRTLKISDLLVELRQWLMNG